MNPERGRGDGDDDGGEDTAYVLAVCEGDRCVPVVPLPGVPRATAVKSLAELAARLRAKGALGRVVVLDGHTGVVAASRRVWP